MDRHNLTERAERILKTDVRYVSRNGFWIILNQATIAISGLVIAVAFANWMPIEDYGVYKFILATAGFLGILKLTGFTQAVTQAVARGYDATIFTAIRSSLVWSIGMMTAAAAVGLYYYLNNNLTLAVGIFIAALSNALIGTLGLYGGYLNGKELFKVSAVFSIITTLGNTLATGTALYFTNNILIIVFANTVSSLALIFVFLLITIHKVDRYTESSSNSIRFGKHLSAQNVLLAGAQHIDKILIFQFVGSIQLALYAFAVMLPDQIYGMFKNVLSVVIPRFAKKNSLAIRKSINKKIFILTVFAAIFSIAYILFARFLFETLFPKYIEAIFYSQIFAVNIILAPSIYLVSMYFHVLQRSKVLYVCKLLGSIFKISSLSIGAFFFGVMGVVIAQILSRIFTLIVYGYYYVTEKNDLEEQLQTPSLQSSLMND